MAEVGRVKVPPKTRLWATFQVRTKRNTAEVKHIYHGFWKACLNAWYSWSFPMAFGQCWSHQTLRDVAASNIEKRPNRFCADVRIVWFKFCLPHPRKPKKRDVVEMCVDWNFRQAKKALARGKLRKTLFLSWNVCQLGLVIQPLGTTNSPPLHLTEKLKKNKFDEPTSGTISKNTKFDEPTSGTISKNTKFDEPTSGTISKNTKFDEPTSGTISKNTKFDEPTSSTTT